MAESIIPVDLLNPGQVFACLGVLEAVDLLQGEAIAAFEVAPPKPRASSSARANGGSASFRIAASGDEAPVERVMRFLEEASVVTRAPAGSPNVDSWKTGWGAEPEIVAEGAPFPYPDPPSPATLPVVLRDEGGNEVPLEYWGDATRRDNVKFWAGSGGYPGSAVLRDAINVVAGKMRQHATNPFALSGPQSNSYRFDWRRDYVPVQDGFSPNKHKNIEMVGFPLVEILAAVGMTHARPHRRDKRNYRYAVLIGAGVLLEPAFHRAALGAETSPIPGLALRRYTMLLDWPGQEDQARCIAQVVEEEN